MIPAAVLLVYRNFVLDSNQRPHDLTDRWSKWMRSWPARALWVCVAAIYIAWLILAVLAVFSDQNRVIGAQIPN